MTTPSTSAIPAAASARLRGEGMRVGYGDREILHGIDVEVLDGEFTVIVGPNACGKSTLLKALARMLRPSAGRATLDGTPLADFHPKALARQLGLLPQSSNAPEGITVADLVARGRYPHQTLLRQWSSEDEGAVADALAAANVSHLAERRVDELSGGQRQRVWISMVLAQDTSILLLDEPTTFLDIAHQVDVLDLARGLQREGRTVVAVLHELNLAFRYATQLIVMREGEVIATGDPREIVSPELIERAYDLPCTIITDPVAGTPLVIPGRAAD